MLAENKEIIYVGKASSLRSRVRSYFRQSSASLKVAAMIRHVQDFDYIVTDSEVEALILECNLIKEHKPKYNVFLKDDKTYPYIKLTLDEKFPRIITTRRVKKDGGKYFGPYTSASSMHETVKLLRKLFPVRNCRDINKQGRPCLNYHIKTCLAPCAGNISEEEYRKIIAEISLFLDGKQEKLIAGIRDSMKEAAKNMEYEKAAELRNQLQAIESVLTKQKIVMSDDQEQDVIAFATGDNEVCVQIFFIRSGKVVGREHFFLEGTDILSDSEIMTVFVKQYYSRVQDIPPKVLLQAPVEDKEIIRAWLKEKRQGKVSLQVPQIGDKLRLVEMVARNAGLLLEEARLSRQKKKMAGEGALLKLQEYLSLPKMPVRIECYDISNIQGTDTVGSMVVFENGLASTGEYRKFKVTSVKGANDYAALQEVLYRRFKREANSWPVPDMVIIDGGRGQLSAARAVMKVLGVSDLPTFALAKKQELLYTEDCLQPIKLPEGSEALYLIQRIRDEAHRFAISYHRKVRNRDSFRSLLDEIQGIGPKRKKALIEKFGTIENLKMASLAELELVAGMTKRAAAQVYNYFCR